MKTVNNTTNVILEQVRRLYHANSLIYKSLPRLKKKASTPDLKESYDIEIGERLRQQHRIEIIFKILKVKVTGNADDVISAMTDSQKKLTYETAGIHTDNMMIITSRAMTTAQVQGYESTINCAATTMDPEITRLLRRALREEKEIEKRLDVLQKLHGRACEKKEYEEVCDTW